jgi:hypothetical protein
MVREVYRVTFWRFLHSFRPALTTCVVSTGPTCKRADRHGSQSGLVMVMRKGLSTKSL